MENDLEQTSMFSTMSFALDEGGGDPPATKKRKLIRGRACDMCRQRKIKCDGDQGAGQKCRHCIMANTGCTYSDNGTSRKRNPNKTSREYIEMLEKRLQNMERLLSESQRRPSSSADGHEDSAIPARMHAPTPEAMTKVSSGILPAILPETHYDADVKALQEPDDVLGLCGDDEDTPLGLVEGMKQLGLHDELRYYGKASGPMLVHRALELRRHSRGDYGKMSHSEYFATLAGVRPAFWQVFPWETATESESKNTPEYTFPAPDLTESLIDLYFKQSNLYIPLLHRPTFERSVRDGLHYREEGFAATVLLVCAIASRFSDDDRVTLDDTQNWHSSGWKWFIQVRPLQIYILMRPSLYDLQKCVLSVLYMQGCSVPRASWTMIGTGLRMAQDIGLHRKKMAVPPKLSKADHEMWKRAFWCLVCIDRTYALALGRTVAIQDEDIAADFPIICDDEYWFDENGNELFVQPQDKPSAMAFFVSYLQLLQILAFSLRTVYSLDESRLQMGLAGSEWQENIVTELDSALNKWANTVPDHLRWDPHREDEQFFNQSVVLHCVYYNVQILVHRAFIPRPGQANKLSFPSLAICTNAARTLIHIAGRQLERGFTGGTNHCVHQLFGAVLVLLLNVWSNKMSGQPTNTQQTLQDIQTCLGILKGLEKRWPGAGRIWDILRELAFAGDIPFSDIGSSSKLSREAACATTGRQSWSPGTSTMADRPPMANSERLATNGTSAPFLQTLFAGSETGQPHGLDFASCSSNNDSSTSGTAASSSGNSTSTIGGPYLQPINTRSTASNAFSHFDPAQDCGGYRHVPSDPLSGPPAVQGDEGLWDMEAMTLWPTGLELEDWGPYFTSMSNWTPEQRP